MGHIDKREPQCGGYGAGHPSYYVLGGAVLPPRCILEVVIARGYRGYLAAEIDRIDALPEPKRSEALCAMKAEALAAYRADLSRYREVAVQLHRIRRDRHGVGEPRCESVHQSISLKHNHLFNDLAHLAVLNGLRAKQRDLFDL
ncbi:hypothetical protein SAMN05518801_1113 [Novosphingobium sp. CF614]|uniref:hypothetical protein n=1 Tax=Novosphingobium sp. CF614 TaxID=1884364 RepID=UPI0008E7CF49|nr:hypothetical protein [Novosphingobium sp. CF614]SFG22005.1 hypothetical protein SAMN05518801_1113 [Novosphingobium sp. CF614]